MEILAKNLRALRSVNPQLAQRLQRVQLADCIIRDQQNRIGIRHRQAWLTLDVAPSFWQTLFETLDQRPTLLIGCGDGRHLSQLAEREGAALLVWERTPLLLRVALEENDLSVAIAAGKLKLCWGGELFTDPRIARAHQVLAHPSLSAVYRNELRVLEDGLGPQRALVADGSLYVDDLCETLWNHGFSVLTTDIQQMAASELVGYAKQIDAELLCAINFHHGLPELAERAGCKLVCWEIDPAIDHPAPCKASASSCHVFTYREANIALFKRAGIEHVHYLPLAANPRRRRPVSPSANRGAPLCFVGASMVNTAQAHQLEFVAAATRAGLSQDAAHALMQRVLEEHRRLDGYQLVELMRQHCAPLIDRFAQGREDVDPVMLLGETLAAEHRLNLIAHLGRYQIDVWGDEGWSSVAHVPGVRYRGHARHGEQLTQIYSDALINIDIGRIYQRDIVTMRVFDVLACAGFLLTEHSEALDALFEVGVELESFRSEDELHRKIDYYLARPDERARIAQAGRQAIVDRHAFDHRLETILKQVGLAS
ncbi:MAG: glycosyltransferase [Deltaproteobacteria bacterium]|nr:glycosyltransferase [Deltaproteobacteria bacterium]